MKILLFLILIPFVEIYTFILVGSYIGALTTIWITIISAIIGINLVRNQSNKEQIKAMRKMQEGEAPVKETLSSLYLFLAGVMLLLPGLVTDFLGALLLFPFIRLGLSSIILKKISSADLDYSSKQGRTKETVHISIKGKRFYHRDHDKSVIEGIVSEKHND